MRDKMWVWWRMW